MHGQLVPCGGGSLIPLRKSRLVVGRAPDCDIALPLGTVSSKHCLLELRDGVWFVTDLASRNGIRINGVRCQEGRLESGSVLAIAHERFQVEYAAAAAAASSSASPLAPAIKSVVMQSRTLENDTTSVEPPPSPARTAPRISSPPAARAGTGLGELVPCGGGPPIPLLKPNLLVGRSPACDIAIPDPLISSKHCQLEFKSGFWHVRDLGSRNGIRVDGVFQLAKYLRPGEVLSIAKRRFEVMYTPLAEEPPPDDNPFALSLLEKSGLARKGAAALQARLPAEPEPDPTRKKWKIDDPTTP
jgi:adenylate cyclase